MKQYKIKVNGTEYDVVVDGIDENGKAELTVNGQKRVVEISTSSPVAEVIPAGPHGASRQAVVQPVPSQAVPQAGSGPDVLSPLPGVILSVNVNVGDRVSAGQSVAVLEAMKMENEIEAEKAGTVKAVFVRKGDSVLEGAKIITIE